MSSNPISRKEFLALSGMAIPALLAAQTGPSPDPAEAELSPSAAPAAPGAKRCPLGLQMYSVRHSLAANLPSTVAALAEMGYEVLEFYAPYEKWSFAEAKLVRKILDDHGVRCLSTHNSIESFTPGEGLGRAIELCQILGVIHPVLTSPPESVLGTKDHPVNTAEAWKRFCGELTEVAGVMKRHGLSAGYYNHAAEWLKPSDGGDLRVVDIVAAYTPPDLMLQLDAGTCVQRGADPVAWIRANPGRVRSIHCKEWGPAQGFFSLFGQGAVPWKDIFAAAESVGGIEYYLLEQEECPAGLGELDAVKLDLESWRRQRPEYRQPYPWGRNDPAAFSPT